MHFLLGRRRHANCSMGPWWNPCLPQNFLCQHNWLAARKTHLRNDLWSIDGQVGVKSYPIPAARRLSASLYAFRQMQHRRLAYSSRHNIFTPRTFTSYSAFKFPASCLNQQVNLSKLSCTRPMLFFSKCRSLPHKMTTRHSVKRIIRNTEVAIGTDCSVQQFWIWSSNLSSIVM